MHYNVKNSGVRDRTHDLWIRKRVCYPLHHSDPPLCVALTATQLFEMIQTLLSMHSTNVYFIWHNIIQRILNIRHNQTVYSPKDWFCFVDLNDFFKYMLLIFVNQYLLSFVFFTLLHQEPSELVACHWLVLYIGICELPSRLRLAWLLAEVRSMCVILSLSPKSWVLFLGLRWGGDSDRGATCRKPRKVKTMLTGGWERRLREKEMQYILLLIDTVGGYNWSNRWDIDWDKIDDKMEKELEP